MHNEIDQANANLAEAKIVIDRVRADLQARRRKPDYIDWGVSALLAFLPGSIFAAWVYLLLFLQGVIQ